VAIIVTSAVVIFLAGVVTGAWLASFYPRHDAAFKEYLRREYGTGKHKRV
jgi:hypothetical protein